MFSGWVEAFLSHKADALTVAKELFENVFPSKGVPSTISSNQGAHFTE